MTATTEVPPRPTHAYCSECKEDSAIAADSTCLWCGSETTKRRGGGRPKGVYGYITDTQLRGLYEFHLRGVSQRELGRRVWEQAGYSSAKCAGQAISEGWKRLGLRARDRREATAASNRTRAHNRGRPLRRCTFVKATGKRCERMTGLGRCWHHREENMRRRLAQLHAHEARS